MMFKQNWFTLIDLALRFGIHVPVAFSNAATNTFLIPCVQSKQHGESISKRASSALAKLKEQIQLQPNDVDWRVRFYIQERGSDSRLANLIAYRDVENGTEIIRVVMLNEI